MHVTRQTWLHLVSMLPPASLSLALGIILIRDHALAGAAINYITVSIVAVATSIIISARILPFEIPYRNFAKVALAARSESFLNEVQATIRTGGGEAIAVPPTARPWRRAG